MKKYLCIAALLAVSLSLGACGETGESTTAETTTGAAETTTTTAATEETTTTTTTEMTTTTEATTTEATTTEEVVESSEAEEELYTVEECLTKIVEEDFGETVESIFYNSVNDCLTIEIAEKDIVSRYGYDVFSKELLDKYSTGEKVRRKDFITDYSDYYGGFIEYAPEESEIDVTEEFYTVEECAIRLVKKYYGEEATEVKVVDNHIYAMVGEDIRYEIDYVNNDEDDLIQKYNSGEKVDINWFFKMGDHIGYDPDFTMH